MKKGVISLLIVISMLFAMPYTGFANEDAWYEETMALMDELRDVMGEELVEEPETHADEPVWSDNGESYGIMEENAEDDAEPAPLTSSKFTLYIDILQPDGVMLPSDLRFNIFTEWGEWLANRCVAISEPGTIAITFDIPEYEIGSRFIIVPTTGAEYVTYYTTNYHLYDGFLVETYAYSDDYGYTRVSDNAHVSLHPLYEADEWSAYAESFVNDKGITSDTPYMIWVSKKNFTVSVFLNENGRWDCINHFGCSIGAPDTPTVTGQYKYYKFEKIWDYGSYYVGPIIKFYNGYAIHTTLINKDGTDYDGRIGHMISHGCVRVRPENMDWLVYYIPLNTRIYVTNE